MRQLWSSSPTEKTGGSIAFLVDHVHWQVDVSIIVRSYDVTTEVVIPASVVPVMKSSRQLLALLARATGSSCARFVLGRRALRATMKKVNS